MEKNSTKIAIHKVHKYGPAAGSFGIFIPPIFAKENDIDAKTQLHIYRTIFVDDNDNKSDALIIVPEHNNKPKE